MLRTFPSCWNLRNNTLKPSRAPGLIYYQRLKQPKFKGGHQHIVEGLAFRKWGWDTGSRRQRLLNPLIIPHWENTNQSPLLFLVPKLLLHQPHTASSQKLSSLMRAAIPLLTKIKAAASETVSPQLSHYYLRACCCKNHFTQRFTIVLNNKCPCFPTIWSQTEFLVVFVRWKSKKTLETVAD